MPAKGCWLERESCTVPLVNCKHRASKQGLDHARSELLDRRVVMEVGESASLAKKEILDLLQAALGETIVNPGINAGLDDMHDSILAPGSLARAMNDFFNAFHELSASPDEPTIKQELYNKTETLVRRFNDAGSSLDQIESDLSDTVRRSVDDINRVLAQLHEVNKQVRRFELQDKGRAVSYRDRRQALLEELSRLMDFKVVDDVDSTTGKPSGFINIFANSKDGREVNFSIRSDPKTSPMTGVRKLSWERLSLNAISSSKGCLNLSKLRHLRLRKLQN